MTAGLVSVMLEPEKMREKTPPGKWEEMEQVKTKSSPLMTSTPSGPQTSPVLGDVRQMLGCCSVTG